MKSFCLLLLWGLWALPVTGKAHPISVAKADFHISSDGIEAEISVFMEDLLLYYPQVGNKSRMLSASSIRLGTISHRTFMEKHIYVLDENGQRIKGKVVDVELPTPPKEGIPYRDLMKYDIVFTMKFPLSAPPSFLSFYQLFGGGRKGVPAQMLTTIYQNGHPLAEPFELTNGGNIRTFAFEWDETDIVNHNFNSINAHIAIKDDGIVLDLTAPLPVLETWERIPRKKDLFIDKKEWQDHHRALEAWLSKAIAIEVGDTTVSGKVTSISLVNLKDQEVSKLSSKLGRLKGRVNFDGTQLKSKNIRITWQLFNAEVFHGPAVIDVFGHERKFPFATYNPIFTVRGSTGLPASPKQVPHL